MKINWRLWLPLGTLAALGGAAWAGWIATGIPGAAAQLDEELAAARKLGMPVNAEEVRALASSVQGANAGPVYKGLAKHLLGNPKANSAAQLYHARLYGLTEREQKDARSAVAALSRELAAAEKASRMPTMDMERRWEDGAMVPLPEYSQMRVLAMALALRAGQRSEAGDSKGALEDAKTIFAIAAHMRQEPTMISAMVSAYVDAIGLTALEFACARSPQDKQLIAGAVDLASKVVPLDGRRALAGEMLCGMSVYRAFAQDPEKFAMFYGYRSQDLDPSTRLVRFASIRRAYEGRFAHYHRRLYEALPSDPRNYEQTAKAFSSFYLEIANDASGITKGAFSFMQHVPTRDFDKLVLDQVARQRVTLAGLLLLQNGAPFPIEAPKLPDDPYTHRPLAYRSDGKSFVIFSVGQDAKSEGGKRKPGFNEGDISFGYPPILIKEPRPIAGRPASVPAGAPKPAPRP